MEYLAVNPAGHKGRRGSALVTVLVFTSVLVMLGGAALTFTSSSVSEVERERRQMQALYSAEAGVNAGLARLGVAHRTGDAVDPNVGTVDTPDGPQAGDFWTSITANGDGTFTVMATGEAGAARRSIEAIVQPMEPSPFEHSMFAGNFSGDADYELEMGGTGAQADVVVGDIYSGGDISIGGDSTVTGDLRASGTITGDTGENGLQLEFPQLLTMDYEVYHDYDVKTLFDGAPLLSDDCGGTAGQLPSNSPAHIFRKNPSDRSSDVNSTTKDDYFLEDPYEDISPDLPQDGTEAFQLSLPEEANNSVYFIDGNLWLHNGTTYSLKIKNEGPDPTRVTFVVKGNIYFSDNFFYTDPNADGVAFVALSDPDVEDSGNIYFGDPAFGTMQFAEAVMFAENNFYDNNLDAAGSTQVELRGSMTAGNQVAIERDYDNGDGTFAHTKLSLTFDERQASGFLNLPGIPMDVDHPLGYTVATWREVPTPRTFTPATEPIEVQAVGDPSNFEDPFEEVGGPPVGPNTKNWRKRWDHKFQNGWKKQKRNHKWSNPSNRQVSSFGPH